MKTISKLMIASLIIGVLSSNLIGCHTARGFGQDMQAAGKHLQNSAERHLS